MLPRPPYDKELLPVQEAIPHFPISLDLMIKAHNDPVSVYGQLPKVEELLKGRPITHKDYEIPGLEMEDPDIALAVFGPVSTEKPASGRPCVYFIHGGGMVFLNRFIGIEQPLDWIEKTGCILVSVEYRLGPENQQPALTNDCYAGLCWVHTNAATLNINVKRIMIAGHSGGSGLAAAIALMARDKAGPLISAQLLSCPMLDDRNETTSCQQFEKGEPWDRFSNIMAWSAVLGNRTGGPEVSEYHAPARAKDLSGLPPAYIDVGSAELFRDEAVAYASSLWAAGVQAELHVWPGGFHGFDVMAPDSQLAAQAVATKNQWVERALATGK